MQHAGQKNEHQSLKLYIAVWVLLTGYLLFHTWNWDPKDPFITTELFRVWFGFALLSGVWVGVAAWDTVDEVRSLQLWQGLGFALGFILYMLSVLAFNAGVLVGLLFAFDAAIDRLNPNAGMEPVTIHPSIGSEVNRYLLLLFFIAVTIAQTFSVSKPLARWFSSNLESCLNLTSTPAPPEKLNKLPSQEININEEHTGKPEARYFRTTVLPSGRMEVASPELEAGQTVDVVVNQMPHGARGVMHRQETIRAAFVAGRFDFTEHAAEGAVERNISESEIREAGRQAITIEEYPDAKYGPTRLLLVFTEVGRPLHIQVTDFPSPLVRIITLYEPDPAEWEDYERRK